MATKEAMLADLRLEMADITQTFEDVQHGDGGKSRFDLPVEAVVATTLVVQVDGTEQTVSTDYILDAENGIVVFTAAPADGAEVRFTGSHTGLFTDAQLAHFLDTAMDLHGVNRHPALTYGTVEPSEAYLIRLLARHEALWVLATDASYDIDIRTVEGVTVPRSQRYQQLMTLIQGVKARYDELAAALNLGPMRIEQFSLRRVSRMTGRLVPIYLDREVDDNRMPVRVYPAIDTEGATLAESDVATYDIQVYRGESFSETFTFTDDDGLPRDLTGYTVEVYIYSNKFQSASKSGEFTVITTDAATGSLTLTLTRDDTLELVENRDYHYVFKWWDATGEPDTVLQGRVLVSADTPVTKETPG